MADRLAGYAPAVTITDNGAGKCRVTFPAWLVCADIYAWIATDGSHYIYNTTRSATSAISAKGGSESTGYYFDIALDFAGATWVTTDLAFPIRGNTGTSYSTVALAHADASDGDTILLLHGDTTGGFRNLSAGIAWSKTVTLHGGLAKRRAVLVSSTTNNLGAAKTVTYRNIRCQNTSGAALYTGTANANIVADRCVFTGVNGVYLDSTATSGTATVTNCIADGISNTFGTCDGGTFNAYNNTLTNCFVGFSRGGGTMTASNNVFHSVATECIGTIGGSNNYDQKSQSPATGRQTLNDATAKFLRDTYPGSAYDYRVAIGSALIGAGVDVGLTVDIDGNAVATTFPVGCSNGAMSKALVLTTATPAGTYNATNITEGNVKSGVTFGVGGGSTGTYPSAPTGFAGITALSDNGDGTLTAQWTGVGVSDCDHFKVHIHTSSMDNTALTAMTYVVASVDYSSAALSCIISTTAGGAAKLTAGTTYYVVVRAYNGGGQETSAVNLSAAVTNPNATSGPFVVIPDTTPVQLADSATTIYEVPAGKRAVTLELMLCNTHSSALTVTLYKLKSGDSIADDVAIMKTFALAAVGAIGHTWNEPMKLTLTAGTKLQGLASVASKVTATIGVIEITV